MRHSFIDRYSDLDSFIHKLDPRTKLLSSFAFIVVVMVTPANSWQAFAFYFVLIFTLFLISKLPLLYILKRSLVVLPFVLMIAVFIPFFEEGEIVGSYTIWGWQISVTQDGLSVLANVVVRAWLCIFSLILLSATTKLIDLLKAMQRLGIPQVIVVTLSFMYRYIFVLVDEVMRMRQARDSRNFGGSRWYQLKTIGNMIGTLFIRSYERGERVYAAMLSRGFHGRVHSLHQLAFRHSDACFGAALCAALVLGSIILW